MVAWKGATAVVTGAASGIGLALSKAMIARGTRVWMTDINAAGVEKEAKALGANARWAALDVRDAQAVRAVVESAAAENGRLDYVFNNAGIGIGGEAHELTVAAPRWGVLDASVNSTSPKKLSARSPRTPVSSTKLSSIE